MKEKINYKEIYCFGNVSRRLITAWLFAAIFMYIVLPYEQKGLGTTEGLKAISGLSGLMVGAAVFILFMVYPLVLKQRIYLERGLLIFAFVLLSTLSLMSSFSAPFLAIVLVICFILIMYMDFGWESGNSSIKEKTIGSDMAPKVAIFIGISFFLFMAAWMANRVNTHSTPTYDFGIFAQMFYSMRTHGSMVTTLERAETMSHLCVHVSFIYYLLLPIYFVIPNVAFLNALQGVVLASAFYPLWKLARSHGWEKWETVILIAILAAYPAFSGGASYDLHENIFLAPLLLWLFYAYRNRNIKGLIVTSVLVLIVKEDAAVYVAIVSIYYIVSSLLKKKYKSFELWMGIISLIMSLVYFVLVTSFLANSGDGVMSSRYNNFIYDGSSSLITVIKAVIMEPMKVLYEATDSEKIEYIWYTLGALAGIPLFTRKYERYILLIPYVLVNLMSDYGYQHSINAQYGYGSSMCLMYLFILNYADIKKFLSGNKRKYRWGVLFVPLLLTLVMFWKTEVPRAMTYIERYQDKREVYIAREEMMDQIPADASVAASTFFTTSLSQRDIIYDIKHSNVENILSVDYILADYGETECYTRFKKEKTDDGYSCFKELLLQNGYEISDISGSGLDIYVKTK